MNIKELQNLTVKQLQAKATELGISEYIGLKSETAAAQTAIWVGSFLFTASNISFPVTTFLTLISLSYFSFVGPDIRVVLIPKRLNSKAIS